MTVNSVSITDGPYVGNNIASSFDYSFVIQNKNEVSVYETNLAGVQTLLTVDTDYTVGNIGTDNGVIVRTAGPLPTGWEWYIRSNYAVTQLTSFNSQGAFFPDLHESAMDKLTYLIQQVNDKISRSLRYPDSYAEGVNGALLPIPEAEKLLRWRDDLLGLENIDISTIDPGAVVISDYTKKISSWAAIAAVTPVAAGQLFELAQHTSGGLGGGTLMAFVGSVTDDGGTQKNALGGFYLKRQYEKCKASFWDNNLALALVNCPDGDIYLENMVYGPVNISLARNNLNIIGAGMPQMSATLDRLENGTVIRGTLLIGGNNCVLRNLGVDRGNYVTNTLLAGVADNALVVHDPGLASVKKGNKLYNVYGLIKNSVAYHAVLYELQADGDLRNVHGRGGEWGVVLKAQNTTFDGLHSYNNIQGGVVLKSDSYAPCSGITGTNVVCREGGTVGNGFYIYAASLQTQNIVVSNINTDGYSVGVKVVCSPRSPYTYPANDIVLDNINIRNANTLGLETFGALVGFTVDNVNISDTVSGKAFKLDDNCLGATIGKITVSAPAGIGAIPADSVYLGGRFTVGSVQSTKGYDLASLGGVTIVPDANRLWNVSKIIGRCNLTRISGSGYTLPNGWTGAFGSVPRSTYQNGRCIMSGRLAVPGTPWTGKEVCFNVGTNMAPTQDLFRVVGGYDATGIKFVPIFITVKTNGDVEVTQLNTATSFPATISFIELDGLEWDVSNLST